MTLLRPKYAGLSLSVKYISVLFPFDIPQFLRVLVEQGFFVPPALEDATAAAPMGARLAASGVVARKADVAVRVDAERQILGVSAPDGPTAVSEMQSLESLLKNEMGVESLALAQYYEFLTSLTARANVSPLEGWSTHFAQVPFVQQASQLLGTNVSPFGLRLAPTGQIANQPDWFEIRIEPMVRAPRDYHYVEMIFRKASRDEVFSFVLEFEKILDELISLVEGGK